MTRDQLIERAMRPSDVPCNGCVECCRKDAISLKADEISKYKWHPEGDRAVLDRKENGECIYLNQEGCGIHENRPDLCRRFDCRVLFLLTPEEKRVIRIQQNPTMKNVYEAGSSRLATL